MSDLTIVLPHFEPYSPTTGLALATIAAEVSAELEQRGRAVTVVAPADGAPTYTAGQVVLHRRGAGAGPTAVDRAITRVIGHDRAIELGYDRRVRRSLAAARPGDVVVVNDVGLAVGIARRAPRSRVFVWLQNDLSPTVADAEQGLAALTGVLAVSAFIAERWMDAAGSVTPVRVVPNGVNAQDFRPAASQPAGPIRSCFVGRIDPNKGPLEAARSIGRAQHRGIDITFDLAGPVIAWGCDDVTLGRFLEDLDEAVASCGGSRIGRVSREDLPAFYAAHDVAFVLSLSAEPFGLVALEAMAGGCAVIASNRGGLPDTCGDAALLVDPEDPGAIDHALDLLGDRSALTRIRRHGRAFAEQRTWSRTVDQLLECVEGPETLPGPARS